MVEGAYRKRRAASFRTEESAPKGRETRRTGIRRRIGEGEPKRKMEQRDCEETKEYEEYCERASERMREC